MNIRDIINIDNLSLNNFININNNQIKNLQDGIEDNDGVNAKQLNGLDGNLIKSINTSTEYHLKLFTH